MVIHYKPNRTGSRISVTQHFPRRKQLGEIRRTANGLTFAAKGALNSVQLDGVLIYMQGRFK
jgi:hypothetical protein